jgi:CheY-like chemotaxis protein
MQIQNPSQCADCSPPTAEADVIGTAVTTDPGITAKEDPYGLKRRAGIPPPKQILIVEDNAEVRVLVARTIVQAGFKADTARDGEEGWTALCSANYDLVITDHEMPNLSGLGLIERMREISDEPPCILISASLPLPIATLAKIVHRGTVLPKPFSSAELIERVYGLLLLGDLQG